MTCGFSSLENVNLLFNNLVNSNKDALPLNHINKLVNDLARLLNESDFYDIEIRVGAENDDVKTFKAHSGILKARSSYFKAALSDNWIKKSENGTILFEKENISPRIFEVLLTYIYYGIIDVNILDPDEVFELLQACDELGFNELIIGLQNYLITEGKEWIQQNLISIHNISFRYQSFGLLQDYCKELFSENPDLILNSSDFKYFEKRMLISLLKREDIGLKEIEIWSRVIQWGIGQIENLEEENISIWDNQSFVELKNSLKDIIPLIRFNVISSSDFHKKIKPFKKCFDKEFYKGLFQYNYNRWPKRFPQKKGPRKGKGELLNLEIKCMISSWIDSKLDMYNIDNVPYDFELVIQGTQDGFSRSVFKEKCYNIKKTVAIMKFKGTGELVGGYNPVGWNLKRWSLNDCYQIETNKSFIFKIDAKQINNSILSRVNDPNFAIYHNSKSTNFMVDNVRLHERLINFNNLQLCNAINDQPYCFYYDDSNSSYKKNLNLVNKYKKVHLIVEYEIYKLVRKNQQ